MNDALPWIVKEAIPQKNYTIKLKFADQSQKIYDARELLNKKMYHELQNIEFFLKAKAQDGTVIWNENIDIAPEILYEKGIPI